jgi:lysophospholipase L1-like esterase
MRTVSSWDKRLCWLGGLSCGLLAAYLRYRMWRLDAPQWGTPSWVLAGLSLLMLGAAFLNLRWLQKLLAGGMKLALTTGVVFGLAEAACRALKLDFNDLLGARRANEAFPIYFRLPTHPSGDIYFTREPGSRWTGKPMQTLLKNHRSTDVAYTDEAELTLRYSQEGFRNSDDLRDWDIAITGDSFTESGYLPDTALFTHLAGQKLGLRVKNLGITDTGNFSHNHYLQTYGQAPSCRTAVLAFFEGNDLYDNVREQKDLQTFQQTGSRPSHDIPVEKSLLKTLWSLARDFKKLKLQDRSYANATYQAANGPAIPVSIADAPPSSAQMMAEEKTTLSTALAAFATTCRQHQQRPYLLYLPCKRRVCHGLLKPGADYPEPEWQPGDLPAYLAQQCTAHGISVIDATPALTTAAQKGTLPYNTIYDTHFNAAGHEIVAETLAKGLRP